MNYYYFDDNTDINGKHKIHTKNCPSLPSEFNMTFIGQYSNSHEAMIKAQSLYPLKSFAICYCCNDYPKI